MEDTQNYATQTTNEEIDLLDLVVTVAENIKLLIIGPLIVGLCALGIAFLLPQTFQSVAVIQAEQSTAALITTTAVLDPVIAALGLGKGKEIEEARIKLREQIKAVVGRNDKLLTLTVSDHAATQAQAIAQAVLQQTYQASQPRGAVRARLEAQLAEAKVRLNNAQGASMGILKRLESGGGGVELARGYAELLSATGAAQNQISSLETQLEGIGEAQLLQPPTLPIRASQPKKGLIAIGATLAAGVLLLLFVFVRQALRSTAANSEVAVKLMRIRQSLALK